MEIKRDKYTIKISENVLSILEKYNQKNGKNESGGILLGSIEEDGIIYISKLSLPNPFDKSSRYSFDRDKKIAQILVEFEFHNSDGTCIYLGEWHTHPEKTPSPSHIDIKMITQQYTENKINVTFLIMIIKGTESLYIGVYDGINLIQINLNT